MHPQGSLLDLDLRVFVAAKPIHLILVEKDKQRLRVLQHDGKLKIIGEYKAATGENEGPKEREGDEKTPEGIYFITKIYTDSKVTIFGKRAFHLNYPNIFDKETGKDGNGIFVHGTNKELISNSTNGCITLNNADLENLVEYLPIETIPVVVVSSLQSLGSQNFVDKRIASFSFNHFERAKAIMLPTELDWRQVFFENLYMIHVGNQTAAVGEYRSFANPDGLEGGFARSYLSYDEQDGWIERQSFRKKKRVTLDPVLQAQADNFLQLQSLQDGGEGSEYWQERDDLYLDWYKQALALDEEWLLQQGAQITEVERKRPAQDFFWLFLLSVSVSIASVWVLVKIRLKQEEAISVYADDQSLEIDDTLVCNLRNDIAWIHTTLEELRLHLQENDAVNGKKEQETLRQLEEELQEKEAELTLALAEREALRRNGEEGSREQQKEIDAVNEQLAAMRDELQVAQEGIRDLDKSKKRLVSLEQDLQEKSLHMERLLEENAQLQTRTQQTVKKEAFNELLSQLDRVEVDLQEAQLSRQNLHAQIEKEKRAHENAKKQQDTFRQLEQEFHAKEAEFVRALAEREDLQRQEEENSREQQRVIDTANKQLAAMRDELQVAENGLMDLEKSKKHLASLEKELQEKSVEMSCLREDNLQLQERIQQTVEREAFSELQSQLDRVQADLKEALAQSQGQEELIAKLLIDENRLKSQKDEETKELARVREKLLQAESKLNESMQSHKKSVEQMEKFLGMENALQEHKTEIDTLLHENQQLKKVSIELKEESRRRLELEEQVARVAEVDEQLQSRERELKILAAENATLQELAAQAEYKEKLETVQARLHDLELQLQEAAVHRASLEEQVGRLLEVETSFVEQQRELVRLTVENKALQKQVESSDEAEEVVVQEAEKESDLLYEEKEEEVLPHGADYLPSDVLKQWIGK